jgi:hypothetical protein
MNHANLLRYSLTLLIVLFSFCLHAQDDEFGPSTEKPDTVWFEITAGPGKVPHSLYRSIGFLDQRPDTVTLGLFATTTRYDIRVVPLHPLALQFDSLLGRLTDASAEQGALFLQLQRFTIYDINTSFTHKVAASLRAFLYARIGQSYRKLAVLDTVLEQSSGEYSRRNSHKLLLAGTAAVLDRFIRDALLRIPTDITPSYSWNEMVAIDSLEKNRLPLYTADSLTDGVYMHANSFLQQRPDYTRFLPIKAGREIVDLQVAADSNHPVLHPDGVYSIVQNGKVYVFTRDGYKPLKKIGNDFYYVGKIKIAADNLTNVAIFACFATTFATMGVGLNLFSVWRLPTKKSFLLKMDYMNGQFTPVKPLDREPKWD